MSGSIFVNASDAVNSLLGFQALLRRCRSAADRKRLVLAAWEASAITCHEMGLLVTANQLEAASADGKVKFSLGFVRGSAIRLGPVLDHGLVLSGSVEDGLSLLEMGAPSVWAAPGEGTVKGMHLPELVRSVVIGADGDAEGRRHAEAAGTAIICGGREVRIVYPGGGARTSTTN